MKWLIHIFLALVLVLLAAAVEPPSLTNFQQFYGTVSSLPSGSFTLKAKIGTIEVTTPIAADGKYGQAEVFKVTATGNPTIYFYVVSSLGAETNVRNVTYQSSALSELNLAYPAPPVPSGGGAEPGAGNGTGAGAVNDTGTDTGTGTTSRMRRNETTRRNVTTTTTPTTCLQSWQCGSWSLCRDSRQTRVCYRVDNCEVLKTQGAVVTQIPKPLETQACLEEEVAAPSLPQIVCTANAKRCEGMRLQQCSPDGTQWGLLQSCANGCDSLALECKTAPISPPVQKPLPVWIYYLAGSVVLAALIIIVLVSLLGKKKYSPLKDYITQSRIKGYSDAQIRSRLIDEGWPAGKVDKFLK